MSGYGRRDPSGMDMAMAGMNFLSGGMRTGQAIGEQRYETDERDGINQAYEYIAGKLGNQGDLSQLDGDPILNTRHGTMAMGQFMQQRLTNETARLGFLQKQAAADAELYEKTLRPMMGAADEAYKSGDMARFGQIAGELSKKFPFPYRYTLGEDGMFKEEFRSDKHEGWVDTNGRITPQQAYEQLQGLIQGEQRILVGANMRTQDVNPYFLSMAARYKMGTAQKNAQNLADPKQWIPLTKDGKTMFAVIQNRVDDYSAEPSFLVMDESGKHSGYYTAQQLTEMGAIRADVKADIQNKQRIAAGKGAGGKGGIGGLGSKDLHVAILQSGYGYDSTQKWYYKVNVDEEGKAKVDLSQPMSMEFYQELTRKKGTAAGGATSNDSLGIRSSVQNAAATRPAPPNIPQQQAQPTAPAQNHNIGQLVSYPRNGLLQWAIIGEDGQPKEISPEEAKRYGQTQSPAVETPPSQATPRQPRVNINDVRGELTPEEDSEWQKTGKLPSRYNQIR